MSAIKQIERDLDWRESEIGTLKILISSSRKDSTEKLVLYRAGWALLYAHFEGFCKFSLTVYFDEVCAKVGSCSDLAEATQLYSLGSKLRGLRNLEPSDLFQRVLSFQADHVATAPKFPEVDTESNLWPNTLRSLLKSADISIGSLDRYERTLYTLVSRRNKIAHGERDLIQEDEYYFHYQDVTTEIMYDLALAIDERLGLY